jgi:hypothetical protein
MLRHEAGAAAEGHPRLLRRPRALRAPGDFADVWSDRLGVASPHAIAANHLACAVVGQLLAILSRSIRCGGTLRKGDT